MITDLMFVLELQFSSNCALNQLCFLASCYFITLMLWYGTFFKFQMLFYKQPLY